ncbi:MULTISPECIES: hypothetical protein [Avibacterium]|uniref:hypothetical protein n=1 Tax=Avibacterium TaxID=292486 RepID=UPI000301A876|nr:hypothetical protein [Avibacterium paragallinarum]AZI13306.1 hypothetical protein EIA51_00785 [Avibacterium paragallinarum]QIR12770.1 hypothetical protein HBL79_11445 [Avibacterium paragallinarum]QJE10725.1 hypothetical protein HHJ62_10760 [Avibacterium paragallinarum]QJE12918.1 hypothetical protein HHJ61_10760 [Avibacterium paragallinarum]QJE15121.1 hypothetical protein HHJ60_10790 [Avibacterium paragallinarum]
MSNRTDLKSIQSHWTDVRPYLLKLTSEDMQPENSIKINIDVLPYYFSPFILELLSEDNKKKLTDYLLNIKKYLINEDNYTLSTQHCQKVENLVNEMTDYLNKIGGNIPNIAILEKYDKATKEQIENIEKRANSLFGELTTHSIKKAFNEQAENFLKINKRYTAFFYILLVLLFFIGSITFILSLGENEIKLNNFINKIIIIMPFIWAILFTNKKVNESKKLEQAYLHKAVIAQSYLNYLKFIKSTFYTVPTGDTNSYREVLNTLHKVTMESLALNPALLLDKSTAEKIPMEELLSRILDKTTTTKKGE